MSEVTQAELELEALKMHADRIGLSYHPKIGLEKLQEKIDAFEAAKAEDEVKRAVTQEKVLSKREKEEAHKKEMMRLVRVRVACHNPMKQNWDGDIFSVGNSVLGQVKKYVPFNNDAGYHIPYVLYKHLCNAKCQIFRNEKSRIGNIQRPHQIKEYSVEVMPALTEKELKELAQRQQMAKGTVEA